MYTPVKISLYLLCILSACKPADSNTVNPVQKQFIEHNGVKIHYEDRGTGEPTLLFVHGWNIDKNYWHHQVDSFSSTHRIVTIDLPGYGQSGKNRTDWTVEEYGKDVNTVIQTLDLHQVILIGHSMSGAIVLEAALTNPDRILGIVGVDNFTNFGTVLPPETKKQIADYFKLMKSDYTNQVIPYTTQSLFSPSTDTLIRSKILNDFLMVDSILTVNILEKNFEYPLDDRLKMYPKTLYLINSTFNTTDTSGFVKYKVPYEVCFVGPTGHYPMIENPNEFNSCLQGIIQKMRR